MSAIVSQPGSLGNPTPFYRVVDFTAWCHWVNGPRTVGTYPVAISEHTTPGLAYQASARYNADNSVINWERTPQVAS